MNMLLSGAVAALLATTTPVLAHDSLGTGQDPAVHGSDRRLTEAELKQLERVHVTADTAALGTRDDTTSQTGETFGIEGPDAQAHTLIQWTDRQGKNWSVSIDSMRDARIIATGVPLIDSAPVLGDLDQQHDVTEAIQVTAIPEPASLALLTIGLLLVCPHSSQRATEPDANAS